MDSGWAINSSAENYGSSVVESCNLFVPGEQSRNRKRGDTLEPDARSGSASSNYPIHGVGSIPTPDTRSGVRVQHDLLS